MNSVLNTIAILVFMLAITIYFKKRGEHLNQAPSFNVLVEDNNEVVQKSSQESLQEISDSVSETASPEIVETVESQKDHLLTASSEKNLEEQDDDLDEPPSANAPSLSKQQQAVVMKCLSERARTLKLQGVLPQEDIDDCHRKVDLAPGQKASGAISSYSSFSG